jgi:hypothetical protein
MRETLVTRRRLCHDAGNAWSSGHGRERRYSFTLPSDLMQIGLILEWPINYTAFPCVPLNADGRLSGDPWSKQARDRDRCL